MTSRLSDITGINPLTINQTSYSENSKRKYENPYYQLTDVDEPSVYMNQDSVFGQYRPRSWFDISIFHPRTKNFNRPEWLLIGNRVTKELDFSDATIDCPCLVLAYLDGEEIGKAIPYDIQEVHGKKVNLVLEKGVYQIIIWNVAGKALKTEIEQL
jgi:hypothetical protein